MIVQNLNFDQTVALAKAKAEKMIENYCCPLKLKRA